MFYITDYGNKVSFVFTLSTGVRVRRFKQLFGPDPKIQQRRTFTLTKNTKKYQHRDLCPHLQKKTFGLLNRFCANKVPIDRIPPPPPHKFSKPIQYPFHLQVKVNKKYNFGLNSIGKQKFRFLNQLQKFQKISSKSYCC